MTHSHNNDKICRKEKKLFSLVCYANHVRIARKHFAP